MSLSRSCSLKLTTLGTAFAVVILGTFTSAYAVSIANGHIFYPWYFLSSSIDYAPGSCIGSFGLSPSTLLCVPILSWVRFTQVREVSDSRANRWMLYSSILSAIGAHGVASVQAHADLLVHLLFAGLFFGFGLVVAVLAVVQDYQCPKLGTPYMRNLRKCLVTVIFLFLAALCGIFLFVIHPRDCMNDGVMGSCGIAEYQKWPFMQAVLEIIIFACLLSIYGTFLPDLHGWRVKLVIEREGTEPMLTPDRHTDSSL